MFQTENNMEGLPRTPKFQEPYVGTPKQKRKIVHPEQRRHLTTSDLKKLDSELNPQRDADEVMKNVENAHKDEERRVRDKVGGDYDEFEV